MFYTSSVDALLHSPMWYSREAYRKAYLHSYTAKLWHRALWRARPSKAAHAEYMRADQEEMEALRRHNNADGAIFSHLMHAGYDLDQLPEDRDECPLCRGEIIEDYGCTCTNVDLAREIG